MLFYFTAHLYHCLTAGCGFICLDLSTEGAVLQGSNFVIQRLQKVLFISFFGLFDFCWSALVILVFRFRGFFNISFSFAEAAGALSSQ